MAQVSQLNRNIAMLQMEQTENSKATRDDIMIGRQRQQANKLEALEKNEDASNIRADGKTEQAGYQAAAAALGIAAAVCACIPIIGPIIAAILAAVAAIVMLVGTLQAKAKEEQAAAKEKQAGLEDVKAEREKTKIDDKSKTIDDRKDYVDQLLAQLKEAQQQEGQNIK